MLNCIVEQSAMLPRVTSPRPNHKLMVRIPSWEVGIVGSNPSCRRENWTRISGPEAFWTTANCVRCTQSLSFLQKQLEGKIKSEPVSWDNSTFLDYCLDVFKCLYTTHEEEILKKVLVPPSARKLKPIIRWPDQALAWNYSIQTVIFWVSTLLDHYWFISKLNTNNHENIDSFNSTVINMKTNFSRSFI